MSMRDASTGFAFPEQAANAILGYMEELKGTLNHELAGGSAEAYERAADGVLAMLEQMVQTICTNVQPNDVAGQKMIACALVALQGSSALFRAAIETAKTDEQKQRQAERSLNFLHQCGVTARTYDMPSGPQTVN